MKINFNVATLPQKVNATAIKNKGNKLSFCGNDYDNDTFEKKPTTYYKKGSLEWALNWNADERRKELDAEFIKDIKRMSFWKRNFTPAIEDLKNSYNKTFEIEQIMIITLLQNKTELQIEKAELQNERNRINDAKKELEEIAVTVAKEAEQVQKLSDASQIANAFKVDNEGGLDDCIAGYDAEKQLLRNAYIEQVEFEKGNNELIGYDKEKEKISELLINPINENKNNIPAGIIISEADDTTGNAFIDYIKTNVNANVVSLNTDSTCFVDDVYSQLKKAKENYFRTGKRTILAIKNSDILLGNKNVKNVANTKGILLFSSNKPEDEIDYAFATTFLFETENPQSLNKSFFEHVENVIHLPLRTKENNAK